MRESPWSFLSRWCVRWAGPQGRQTVLPLTGVCATDSGLGGKQHDRQKPAVRCVGDSHWATIVSR